MSARRLVLRSTSNAPPRPTKVFGRSLSTQHVLHCLHGRRARRGRAISCEAFLSSTSFNQHNTNSVITTNRSDTSTTRTDNLQHGESKGWSRAAKEKYHIRCCWFRLKRQRMERACLCAEEESGHQLAENLLLSVWRACLLHPTRPS